MSTTQTIAAVTEIELEPIRTILSQRVHASDTRSLGPIKADSVDTPVLTAPPPNDEAPSAKNFKLQLLSCCVCFIVAGLNDGSLGTLLPYLLSAYDLTTSYVGIIYATSFAGWLFAAMIMPFTVAAVGSKGTLLAGAMLYTVAQVLRVWVRR